MKQTHRMASGPAQKVVVVNGNAEVLGALESVLEAGHYDMVFVEPGDRAYSRIRHLRPNLVILCTRIERLEGFDLLTMLKLDPDTRRIPVLTYASEHDGEDFDPVLTPVADEDEATFPRHRASLRMN